MNLKKDLLNIIINIFDNNNFFNIKFMETILRLYSRGN